MLVEVDVMGASVAVDVPLGCSLAGLLSLVRFEAGLGDDASLELVRCDGGPADGCPLEADSDVAELEDGACLAARPSPKALARQALEGMPAVLKSEAAFAQSFDEVLSRLGGDGAACARHAAALFPPLSGLSGYSGFLPAAAASHAAGAAECVAELLAHPKLRFPARSLNEAATCAAVHSPAALRELLRSGAAPCRGGDASCPLHAAVTGKARKNWDAVTPAPPGVRAECCLVLLDHALDLGRGYCDPFPPGFTTDQKLAVLAMMCTHSVPLKPSLKRQAGRPLALQLAAHGCTAGLAKLFDPCDAAQRKALLAQTGIISRRGTAPLGAALDLETVRTLCGYGADVNAPCADGGLRLLHVVAREGGDKLRLVQPLLAMGARFDVADGEGETPLHAAAAAGHMGMVNVLLNAGAPVNAADASGVTPLMHVAHSGLVPFLLMALEAGADVKARDKHGRTALHMASSRGAVAELVRRGADPHAPSDFGTPLEAAKEAEHVGAAAALRELCS